MLVLPWAPAAKVVCSPEEWPIYLRFCWSTVCHVGSMSGRCDLTSYMVLEKVFDIVTSLVRPEAMTTRGVRG